MDLPNAVGIGIEKLVYFQSPIFWHSFFGVGSADDIEEGYAHSEANDQALQTQNLC
ncbi:hypothetical protein H6G76_15045 [Nostoc sp. FACHB-152]|uniref:hypothetical protein n=1 Tax=unclassified Nostoc TaxID=2593658 RepID=UPI0016825F63|nr:MULTISPECIES: hypothetical protein [unclassified Nostoc]MBD2448449.1 hypothetical protein [Nostoc sp. FACHB-152]MBD2472556.1 hypothetical protein [Nostoc sp. FACHB-145]